MTINGERGPRIGEHFRNQSISLLKLLGYQELFGGEYGLDFVARPPSPNHHFKRPGFSPDGITAFEFTAQTQLQIDSKSSGFKRNVENYNSSRNENDQEIQGTVLIVDVKVENSKIRELFEDNMYCWDVRHLSFLASKSKLWEKWVPKERRKKDIRSLHESYIEPLISSIRVYNTITSVQINTIELYLAIFHYSPTAVLSTSDVHQFLDSVMKPIKELAHSQAMNTIVSAQLFVAGEVQYGVESDFIEILTEYVDDFVSFQDYSSGVFNYNSAPWCWLLMSELVL